MKWEHMGVEITVNRRGWFEAEVGDDQIRKTTLNEAKESVEKAISAQVRRERESDPVECYIYRKGELVPMIFRGLHAGNGDVLVTSPETDEKLRLRTGQFAGGDVEFLIPRERVTKDVLSVMEKWEAAREAEAEWKERAMGVVKSIGTDVKLRSYGVSKEDVYEEEDRLRTFLTGREDEDE